MLPLASLLPLVGKIFDQVFPDKEKAADAKLKLLELQQNGQLKELEADVQLAVGQLDVNKIEAASTSLFVSGWRPAVGWCAVFGLGFQFILAPLATWGATLAGHPVAFPTLDTSTLLTLLFGMLGLGGMRTVEKMKGVAAK